METFFLALFLIGLTFTVASFLLGFAELDLSLPGLPEWEFGPPESPDSLSPVNVSTVTAFVTWFGGVGYLLSVQDRFGAPLVVALSALGGLAGAAIVFLVFARFLLPGQTPYMRAEDYRVQGALARVTVPMQGDRIGEVVYVKGGTTRSEGARSADGSALPRGSEVVILRYERGIAYVESLEKLLRERDAERPGLTEGSADSVRMPPLGPGRDSAPIERRDRT